MFGDDTSFTKLDIVKQSDGSRQNIPLAPTSDSLAADILYTLLDGDGEEYRFEFYKTDTNAVYSEDIILGEIPVIDTIGAPKMGRQIINLGQSNSKDIHVAVYPNPVDETVFISIYQHQGKTQRHEELTVVVVNVLGEEVYRARTVSGTSLQLNSSMLPSGMYGVRVESASVSAGVWATASFIVNR